MVMKPGEVRRIIAARLAAGELPPKDPERLAAELYLRNGLTQKAVGELLGWNTTNVNQWISQWLDDMRRELVSWETMRAHGGSEYYYVNPASWGRPDQRPPSPEQAQRAAAIRQARDAVRRPPRRVIPKRAVSERLRYATELLQVWPG
jgi:hypothetical protein